MKKALIYIGIAVLAWACQKEIPLKADEAKPRIVVNSTFSVGDTTWLYLSESRNVLHEGKLPPLTNATAQLLDANDGVLGTFTHTDTGTYYLADPKPVAGTTYKISIEAPGLNPIKASSGTPSLTSFGAVDTVSKGKNGLEFEFSFLDDPNQVNYYAVSIHYYISFDDDETGETRQFVERTSSTTELVVLNGSDDIDGKKYSTEFFFTDKTFNGQMFTYTGQQSQYMEDWMNPGAYWVVSLKSLSEDTYKYKLSHNKYKSTEGSPFAEPVQVYSNIEDGFGIFGGISIHRDTIWQAE